MTDLEDSFKEIEIYYRQQKRKLLTEKLSYVFLSITCIGFAHYYVLGYYAAHKIKITDTEIAIADVVQVILVFSCFIFSPLYKFLSDKIFLKMNWDIKTSIFKKVLNNYTHDYHLSFNGALPDEDIANLEFEKGLFDFCSEKDFIFGKINAKPFRISVVNKVSLFSKRFNGIVAITELPKIINDTQQQAIKTTLSAYTNLELLTIVNNKIYIGCEGKKKYFEFEIIKGYVNRQDLTDDLFRFKTIVAALNDLSK